MRRLYLMVLSFTLLDGGIAYASYLGPTTNDLEFLVRGIPSEIFLPDSSGIAPKAEFPTSASLTVRVRNTI
jgi:hypothetical protein